MIITKNKQKKTMRIKIEDSDNLNFVEGRLEGLKILLDTPANKKTMTNAELKFAIQEVEIIRDCMKITAGQQHEAEVQ